MQRGRVDRRRRTGERVGASRVATAEKLQRARELLSSGLNVREAAARLKVGKMALYAALHVSSEVGS